MKIGIVGLPNVGKSTLFNALIRGAKADAQNYPFCTIEPNVGIVEVPDDRLQKLTEISKSEKTIPAVVEFVDIAGLVRGASQGEGLGNKFLAHIRECAAIAMVVRFFENKNITHVEEKNNPKQDIEIVETELRLADLETIQKRLLALEKEAKANPKTTAIKIKAMTKIREGLSNDLDARNIELNDEEAAVISELQLLTSKPKIYIANCSEEQLREFSNDQMSIINQYFNNSTNNPTGDRRLATDQFIPISAKIEEGLNSLKEEEKREYLETLGIKESGLDKLIKEAYRALGLITFLTSGPKESRAWMVKKGATAPEAAGVIHTDFQRGFIAAEVVSFGDFVDNNGWSGARAKGLVRTEGKSYRIKDGDVVLFRFNV
jgi:hypothetical protein